MTLLAVLGVLGGDRLGGRSQAELLDAHAGMRLLRGRHRGQLCAAGGQLRTAGGKLRTAGGQPWTVGGLRPGE